MLPVLAVLGFIGFGYWLLVNGGTATPGAAAEGDGTYSQANGTLSDNDNVTPPNWALGAHTPITANPATWPQGDKIWDIARAIALAEGANVSGSAPDRNNNPGDISDGSTTFGFDPAVTDSKVTRFPDKDTGWKWLYSKLENAARGYSQVYSPDMTWNQIAQKWAGNWQAWVANVTRVLGVDPNSTLRQYTGI